MATEDHPWPPAGALAHLPCCHTLASSTSRWPQGQLSLQLADHCDNPSHPANGVWHCITVPWVRGLAWNTQYECVGKPAQIQ